MFTLRTEEKREDYLSPEQWKKIQHCLSSNDWQEERNVYKQKIVYFMQSSLKTCPEIVKTSFLFCVVAELDDRIGQKLSLRTVEV